MLSKRTNILFEETRWQELCAYAQKKNTSAGDLVRRAVDQVYFNNQDDLYRQRYNAIENIKKIRREIKNPITREEIREMLHYGHKY